MTSHDDIAEREIRLAAEASTRLIPARADTAPDPQPSEAATPTIPRVAIDAAVTSRVRDRLDVTEQLARRIADGALRAALPGMLADYRDRLVTEACALETYPTGPDASAALFAIRCAKAEGVRRALSYLDEMLRS